LVISMAVLADCANVAPIQKLNVMGVFDTLFAKSFPTIHPFMVLVIQFRCEYSDAGEHKLTVKLKDDDAKEFGSGGTIVTVPKIPPGEFAHANQILTFAGVQLTKPTRYHFDIAWDGVSKCHVPFLVKKVVEGADPAGA